MPTLKVPTPTTRLGTRCVVEGFTAMSHDYDPNWDYPCIELQQIEELTPSDRIEIERVIERARQELAPVMGFDEGFEVFFAEYLGRSSGDPADLPVAVYCNGTSSRPVIGFDLSAMREVCVQEGLGLVHQLDLSLAHELAHAYQEACGLDHEHEDGFDEHDAEQFGVLWADFREVRLCLLNPELPRSAAAPTAA